MATSAKSLSLLKELADRLARRTTLAVSSISLDTDNNGWFRVGTAGAGNQTMVIKASAPDVLGYDGIGMAARSFTPSVIQIVLEQLAGNTGTTVMTSANLMPILGEILRQGTRVELYLSVNTNPTGLEDITGTPAVVWEPDLQYRLMDAQ